MSDIEEKIKKLEQRIAKVEELLQVKKPHVTIVDPDQLMAEAKKLIINYDEVSASLFQRKFVIGYARASRLLDQLEALGMIAPGEGAKPRKVVKQKLTN